MLECVLHPPLLSQPARASRSTQWFSPRDVTHTDPNHSAFTLAALPPLPLMTSRTVFIGCAWIAASASGYSAQELGVEGCTVEERSLAPGDRVNEAKAAETSPLSKETMFNDSLCAAALDAQEPQALRHYIHLNNIGIIGLDRSFVGSAQVELVSRFSSAGLCVHEVEAHKSSAELLGVHLDLEQHQTWITNSRYWRVWLGLNCYAGIHAGKCLEVITGHCTLLALEQRAALATFHDVCSFIRKSYHTHAKMWSSVRWELEFLRGVLPLLHSDWRAPFFLHGTSGHIDVQQERDSTNVQRAGENALSSCQRSISPLTRIRSLSRCWDSSGQ